jgi:hypothetical protein
MYYNIYRKGAENVTMARKQTTGRGVGEMPDVANYHLAKIGLDRRIGDYQRRRHEAYEKAEGDRRRSREALGKRETREFENLQVILDVVNNGLPHPHDPIMTVAQAAELGVLGPLHYLEHLLDL